MAMQVAAMGEVSPNNPPVGTDPAMNKKLAEAWKNMEERVKSLAELSNGEGYDENIQHDQVMANLDRVQSRLKKPSNWGKIKQVFSDTLTVISKIGGMAADAASQVFAPAGQCYNALNFVITAWQDYQSVFETLNGLFEDCIGFLNRLPDYVKGNMNANLSSVACDVLTLFVDICDHALKIRRSPMFKIKTFMKIAFLSRNDFDDFVVEIDKLTKKESLNASAQMFAYSAIAADGVTKTLGILNEDKMERIEKQQERHDEQALMKVLDFDKGPATWDQTAQAPVETWNTTNRKIRQRHVQGIGDWLLTDNLFKAWARKNGDEPILAFVGDEGSGKSHLISAAISHLRTHSSLQGSSKEGNSRQLVAFHFLHNEKNNSGIHSLGKSIIWQFATSDASYKQSVAATCREGHIDPKEVLPRLLLENHEEMKKIDAVFYIVINKLGNRHNNVDEAVVQFLKGVLSSKNRAVRILISTTQRTIDKLRTRDISCPTIPVSEKNEIDIRKYIDARMDRMPVLSDSRQRKVAEVRGTIRDSLCRQTKGNYHMINATLDKIRPLESDEEIVDALEGAGRSMSDHIYHDINTLNDVRTPKELKEINEIILWLIYAKQRISPEIMTAVLHVKNKGSSLRSLEDRLKDKFMLFEINNDGFVDFRVEDIPSKIPERGEAAEAREKNTRAVNKGEVDIVQHFLNTVCPPELIQKLELQKYLQAKLNHRQEQIYREDSNTANFLIVQTCAHVLANENDSRLSTLRTYAIAHLTDHMVEVNQAEVDLDSKVKLVSSLARLFRDPDSIDNVLWAGTSIPTLPGFVVEEHSVKEIFKWLKDPTVVAKIDTQDAERWCDVEETKQAKALVEPFVRQMAVHCFRQESSQIVTERAFTTIQKFCHDMEEFPGREGQSRPVTPSDVEKWCQARLEFEPDTLWHTQMAMVFRGLSEISKAREKCERALDLGKRNWRASLLLAKLVESRTRAIGILEKLTKRFEDDSALRENYEQSFADIAYNLGHRYWAQGKFDKAIKSYTESLQRDPSDSWHAFFILQKYRETEKWNEIIGLINLIWSLGDAHLTAMVVEMSDNWEFHEIILRAMVKTNNLNMVDEVYQSAISATKDREYVHSFYLRQYYAGALSALHPAPIDKMRILLEDATKDLPYTNLNMPRAFFLVGYRLGTIYLGKAQRAKKDKKPELAEEWLQKLVDIVPEQMNEDQMRLPLSLFAARYHHTNGNDESARASVHNTLKIAVELLSDDDPGNDTLAYRKILYAVIPFGDEKNAKAALAMMKLEGQFEMSCSSGCGYTWKAPENMWWCMDCINVVLTPQCKEKVKSPDQVNKVCHESHNHFLITEWDAEKMKVPEGQVPYRDTAITMEHWMNKITKRYHLDNSGSIRALLH